MNQKELAKLTDEELLQEAERYKKYKIYDAVIFGVLVGIAIYSSVVNGFGLLTFLPLIYLPAVGRNNTKRKELEKLLQERSLEQ